MSEWQPIETAPTSPVGKTRSILVWVADGGDNRKGITAFGYAYRSSVGSIVPKAVGFHGDWKITHWMPLPDPPKP